jgi:hypothetical protein
MDLAQAQSYMSSLGLPEGKKIASFLRENPGETIPEDKIAVCERYISHVEKELLPRAKRNLDDAKSEAERHISAQRPKNHAKLWSKWEAQEGSRLRNAVTALEEEVQILKAAIERARKEQTDREKSRLEKAFGKLSKEDRKDAERMLQEKPQVRELLIRHPRRQRLVAELRAWQQDQAALTA